MLRTCLGVALLVAVALGCTPDAGFKFQSGPNITVGSEAPVDDDLYLAGGNINVQGPVDGDVVAAGGQVTVGNEVTGDVTAAGGQVRIAGAVGDDLRVAGGDIAILADVQDDVIAAGGTVELAPQAAVRGDLVTGTGTSVVRGTVEGDLIAGSGNVVIAGTVRGNADLQAERVTLEPTARVEGDLRYVSPNEATIRPGAQVMGATTREVPTISILGVEVEPTPLYLALAAVVGQIQWLLGTLVVGFLLLLLAPATFRSARMTLESSPWASLGMGLLALILMPIVAIILGIIAIVIGGIAGAPVLVVPAAVYIVLLALATPVVAWVIGRFIMTRFSSREPASWLALLLGAVALAIIGFIPFLNVVVGIFTVLFGFGAWLLLAWRAYAPARRAQRV